MKATLTFNTPQEMKDNCRWCYMETDLCRWGAEDGDETECDGVCDPFGDCPVLAAHGKVVEVTVQ